MTEEAEVEEDVGVITTSCLCSGWSPAAPLRLGVIT